MRSLGMSLFLLKRKSFGISCRGYIETKNLWLVCWLWMVGKMYSNVLIVDGSGGVDTFCS